MGDAILLPVTVRFKNAAEELKDFRIQPEQARTAAQSDSEAWQSSALAICAKGGCM